MTNIIRLDFGHNQDRSPDGILAAAKERRMKSVVVIGYGEDGSVHFDSSLGSMPEINWLLDLLKTELQRQVSDQ